jgi:hypothetical protein
MSDGQNGDFQKLFQWTAKEWERKKGLGDVLYTDKEVNAFAVGPWMPWPEAKLAGGSKYSRPKP